jgi:hypothetical protein
MIMGLLYEIAEPWMKLIFILVIHSLFHSLVYSVLLCPV